MKTLVDRGKPSLYFGSHSQLSQKTFKKLAVYFPTQLCYHNYMNEFINKYNQANSGHTQPSGPFDLSEPLTKFVGHPDRLPLAARQELIYRYQFLEETIPTLASEYRLTPAALTEWIEEHEIEIQLLETEEDLANFESHVNETYKNLRVRMSGLVPLHTAKAWQSLAISSENLLAALEYATHRLHANAKDGFVDSKELKALTEAHSKMVDKHNLIKQAIEVPAERDMKNIVDAFQKSLEDLFDEIDGSSYTLPSESSKKG